MNEIDQPTLVAGCITVRPGVPDDVPRLTALQHEPTIARWWDVPDDANEIQQSLLGSSDAVLLVIEIILKMGGVES